MVVGCIKLERSCVKIHWRSTWSFENIVESRVASLYEGL
jgi:hypothetical protein